MNEREKAVIAMYDKAIPSTDDLFETSNVNQLAWTLLVLAVGLAIWLAIALVNAENQRYAMASRLCPDALFKGEVDAKCMKSVHSREYWWEHIGYALTHLRP